MWFNRPWNGDLLERFSFFVTFIEADYGNRNRKEKSYSRFSGSDY